MSAPIEWDWEAIIADFLPGQDPCPLCGTWICERCGWRRVYANRSFEGHSCGSCGSEEGRMWPLVHTNHRRGRDHVEEAQRRAKQEAEKQKE